MARPSRRFLPLELSGAELRDLAAACLDRLAPFLDGIAEQPSNWLDGSHKVARSFDEPMPERGVPFRRALARIFDRAIPFSLNTASPGYLAYIPGGGLPLTALADLITDVTNRYTGIWMPAPGLVQLEISVIRWFCAMAGYGPASGGILCSGGSMANLGAVVAAREDKLGERFSDGVMYTSVEAHHSVWKAARVAGFSKDRIRALPVDGSFRMRRDALEEAVRADRAAGLRPFLVAAQAGSTPVGAVDDLRPLGEFCAREDLWLHVDGAYGGFFLMTERGRAAMTGIEKADSIALDPHKGLFLPYGTGCLLVKERRALREAFSESAAYMPPPQEDDDHWDFADLGPELSRPARGLRVWLPFQVHGAAAFREALDEKLDLARMAAEKIRTLPDVEMISEPVLSLFAFRVKPAGLSEEEVNRLNHRILSRINQKQRVFLTGTTLGGRYVLRMCVLSFRTHEDRIQAAIEDIEASIREESE